MQIEFYQNLTKLTDKNHHSLEQKILDIYPTCMEKLIFADGHISGEGGSVQTFARNVLKVFYKSP